MTEEKKDACETQGVKVPWTGYVALVFAILFFSGMLASQKGWILAFDFNALAGKFGTMTNAARATFQGQGGFGAREGFLFGFGLLPSVMLALGMVEVVDHLGGLKAAEKLLTPILRPIMGIPGICGLAMVTSFQSTDAGAGMTRMLRETNCITENEKTIFCAFQFSAGGTVTNYLASGAALFSFVTVPIALPLVLIFVLKVFGANLVRIYLNRFEKESA